MCAALSAEPDTAPNPRRCDPIQILWPVRVIAGVAHLDHINTDTLAGQERQAARRRSIAQQKKDAKRAAAQPLAALPTPHPARRARQGAIDACSRSGTPPEYLS